MKIKLSNPVDFLMYRQVQSEKPVFQQAQKAGAAAAHAFGNALMLGSLAAGLIALKEGGFLKQESNSSAINPSVLSGAIFGASIGLCSNSLHLAGSGRGKLIEILASGCLGACAGASGVLSFSSTDRHIAVLAGVFGLGLGLSESARRAMKQEQEGSAEVKA